MHVAGLWNNLPEPAHNMTSSIMSVSYASMQSSSETSGTSTFCNTSGGSPWNLMRPHPATVAVSRISITFNFYTGLQRHTSL